MDSSGKDTETKTADINKSKRCKNPNVARPLVYNADTSNSASYFFSNPFAPLFPSVTPSCVFSSLLSWGITGCSGALQCGAEQGGGSGGEGEEGIIGIEWSLMLIPCTQTILWLFWLIPGPGPSRYSSPTVAGISPDKQLKEL